MKPAITTFALCLALSSPALVRKSFLSFALPGQNPPPRMMEGPGGGPGGMHPPGWWDDQRLLDELKVTSDQARSIQKIIRDHQFQEIDLRADLEKQELALRTQMEASQPDESQVLAQIDKVGEARTRLEKSYVQMTLALQRVLTAEQAQKLRSQRQRPAPPPRGFGGPEGGPGGPPNGGPDGAPDGQPGPPASGEAN